MSVEKKREEVLESIYEEMSHKSNFSYDKNLADTIKALEAARLADKEFKLKDDVALTDNANKEIDREHEERLKRRELIVNACVAAGTTIFWGLIFICELTATRRFEETGTETSVASRWLKNSVPKPKQF